MTESDRQALVRRIKAGPPTPGLTAEVARALGWTTGPSRAGWKLVAPYATVGGMVTAPPQASAPAVVWFDPEGRERGGIVGSRDEALPPWLTSLDAALGAVPRNRRAQVLYHAVMNHAAWLIETEKDDPALDRLPAFIIAELLDGNGGEEPGG
jgi:hypothetical protein